jgi:uncharacterized protein YegL
MANLKPNTPCQLMSFVLCNGAACTREKLAALMGGFRRFAAETAATEDVQWELCCYDTFVPAVVKSFDDTEITPVAMGRMPLVSRALGMAQERLESRAAQMRAAGAVLTRPWLFLLSDGFALDDTAEIAARLSEAERGADLLYLPFKLFSIPMSECLDVLDRTKRMIGIQEESVEQFFSFVGTLLQRRAALAPEEGVALSKSDFEGWAVL